MGDPLPTAPTKLARWGHTLITSAEALLQVKDADGSSGNRVMLAVEIPLILLATTTVALRIYSRLGVKRKLAVDDVLIVLGLCCAFGRTVISCMSADDTYGFDIAGPDHASEIPYYQHIFERRIAYIFAVVFTRFSVLAYYLRIFPSGVTSLRRCCWILLVLALAQWIEVFTVLLVYCKNISKLWTKDYLSFSGSKCFSSSTYSYSAAIGDSVLDCLIFALPIPYVWSLSKIQARQRIGLMVIFALGFFVCVVALLQIPFIKRRESNSSYFGGAINMLTAIQISLAIIAASLPDIRALVARSFPHFSPLHHRSLVTAAVNQGRVGGLDAERGEAVENEEIPRAGMENRRSFRKPDWMRNSIPASLMSRRPSVSRRPSAYSRRPTMADIPPLPEQSEHSELSQSSTK
ncbi:hypothetical protein B0J11DRAFT_553227 [Dendryphion nanum]|uniref:Rhodopsin domain-containing protein n=1 Tax=Dendryphion nanum TaxID=256645 RepID=A0A9P9DB39_9PLEO|nr:hypothetical protein B0J11DRAFT_553227 [Dendryphion nanum]